MHFLLDIVGAAQQNCETLDLQNHILVEQFKLKSVILLSIV